MLSVLVVDESRVRAGEICAALALAGCQVAAVLPDSATLAHEVEKLQPDLILIETEAPSRDTLEHLAVVNEHMPRPVLLFTQDDEGGTIREAMREGVSAYVVDGLDPKRIRPLIEVARARFEAEHTMRQELEESRRKLDGRKVVDRAKGVLMKARGLDEDGAYHALRKLAMERGKTMAAVAQDVLDMAHLFA